MSDIPLLPGGTGATHLRVYDSVAPDGQRGGSPHMHFACTEAYWVVKGHGAVQTLDASGYRETSLEPGQLTWFSPGVIHRLVNLDGYLEILVVMQNAGLPEAGDFVMTFPENVLRDHKAYAHHAALSSSRAVFAIGEEAARARRDLAVEGFAELRLRFEQEGARALKTFYQLGATIVRPQLERWRTIWQEGPSRAVSQTEKQLEWLERGDMDYLLQGQLHSLPLQGERKLGMCGTLGTFLPEGCTV